MDEKAIKTAQDISKAAVLQNSAVLSAMLFPRACQSGFFEDPHGQTIYVDLNGNTHRSNSMNDLNGWTV